MSAPRPRNFGTHLLDAGVCSLEQLERATQTKVVYGGRLGTNLVELGLLDVETLEAQLAAFLGVPSPNPAWLAAPEPEALAAVPAAAAGEYAVVPLRLEGRLLHVAMRDPTDPSPRDAVGRAGVARAALRLARLHTRAAALFVVRGGTVTGFRGDGELVAPVLDGILLPLDLESAFSRAAVSGDPGRIPAPPDGVDRRILAALKREDACEFVIHPVRIRHHVVNLLYADNGAGPLAQTSLAALGAVCDLLARAYAGLILRRKQGLSQPPSA